MHGFGTVRQLPLNLLLPPLLLLPLVHHCH